MDQLRGEAFPARETWLNTEAAAAFDELRADPSLAVTSDQMRNDLAERHAERVEDCGRA